MRRKITVPEPVRLTQLDGSPVYDADGQAISVTFQKFVTERTCDPSFGGESHDMASVMAGLRVTAAFASALPGDTVPLEDSDWKRLLRATEEPRGGYNAAVARLLVSHMLAITNAQVSET